MPRDQQQQDKPDKQDKNSRRKGGNDRDRKGGKEKDSGYQERIVQIRRVSKVVKGGKKLSFRAIVIIGNEKAK